MIYFVIEDCKDGKVKIGYTENKETFKSRLASLQTGNPREFKKIILIDGTMTDESALHERFQQDHIRGEWFHYSSAIIAYTSQFMLVHVAPKEDCIIGKDADLLYRDICSLRQERAKIITELVSIKREPDELKRELDKLLETIQARQHDKSLLGLEIQGEVKEIERLKKTRISIEQDIDKLSRDLDRLIAATRKTRIERGSLVRGASLEAGETSLRKSYARLIEIIESDKARIKKVLSSPISQGKKLSQLNDLGIFSD